MKAQDELGHNQGIVIANPIPVGLQWDPAEHDRGLQIAFKAADAAGVEPGEYAAEYPDTDIVSSALPPIEID
jgi:pseudouridine-5'-phosphate glycosidase